MLSPLYKLSPSNGKVQVWEITTDSEFYTVTQGQVGGKLQTYRTECFGKNIGKVNETTVAQQCSLEAEALISKKLKTGYTLDTSGEQSVFTPMKIGVYSKCKSKLDFKTGVYLSRKLNGLNGEYRLINDELILLSRGGETFPRIPHLEQSVRAMMLRLDTASLNGELYAQGTSLQQIVSLVKKPKPGSEQLEFHVFDCPNLSGGYLERATVLHCSDLMLAPVFAIPFERVASHEEIQTKCDAFVAQGYEGVVVRTASSLYEYNTRSLTTMKLKPVLDKEFLVLSFKRDKLCHAIYLCASDGGNFSVKRKGTAEARLADAAIAETNIGKYLTVEFESYSDARPGFTQGKPTKPVGLDFRKCSTDGEPLD